MMKKRIAIAFCLGAVVSAWPATGGAQAPPSPDQVVAGLKQNLAESQKRLRQYEWIETTAISLKGEEKSRKQQRVYYGADGTLTKTPMGTAPPAAPAAPSGRRGGRLKERVIENKKDEMQEYMEKAATLIHRYVPPSAALIQKAKDAGKLQVQPSQAGSVRAEFRDFVLPADSMAIDLDLKALLLKTLAIKTYLEKPEDAVTLDVAFGTLTDGTSYSARTALDAAAKNIRVVIENASHRPLAR